MTFMIFYVIRTCTYKVPKAKSESNEITHLLLVRKQLYPAHGATACLHAHEQALSSFVFRCVISCVCRSLLSRKRALSPCRKKTCLSGCPMNWRKNDWHWMPGCSNPSISFNRVQPQANEILLGNPILLRDVLSRLCHPGHIWQVSIINISFMYCSYTNVIIHKLASVSTWESWQCTIDFWSVQVDSHSQTSSLELHPHTLHRRSFDDLRTGLISKAQLNFIELIELPSHVRCSQSHFTAVHNFWKRTRFSDVWQPVSMSLPRYFLWCILVCASKMCWTHFFALSLVLATHYWWPFWVIHLFKYRKYRPLSSIFSDSNLVVEGIDRSCQNGRLRNSATRVSWRTLGADFSQGHGFVVEKDHVVPCELTWAGKKCCSNTVPQTRASNQQTGT